MLHSMMRLGLWSRACDGHAHVLQPLIGARIFRNLAITMALRIRQDIRALQTWHDLNGSFATFARTHS
jgi:hypothetical protein